MNLKYGHLIYVSITLNSIPVRANIINDHLLCVECGESETIWAFDAGWWDLRNIIHSPWHAVMPRG